MTRIIAITNNKGGVGKTHTVFHLSGAFSERGYKVLAVDLDPQRNLTNLFLSVPVEKTLYDVFSYQLPLTEVIYETPFKNIFIAPASERLDNLPSLLQDEPDAQVRLADSFQKLDSSFDYVLLDCPPSVSLTTRNALVAAQSVIIPIEADKFSIEGLDRLVKLINTIKRVMNQQLEIAGILISLFKGRRSIEQLYAEELKKMDLPIFETKINDSSKYRESIAHLKPITHYKPRSGQAKAFRDLTKELERVYAA